MPIKNIDKIEEVLHIEKGTLKAAIEKEDEIEVQIPELVVRTKDEETTFTANIEADKKSRYDSGVEKGEKEAVLRTAKELGFEIADDKAKKIDNLLPLYKDHVIKEANIEPNTKIATLETELNTVRTNYKSLETEHNDLKTNIEKEKQQFKVDKDILASIPKENVEYNVPEDDLLYLIKRKHKFDLQDGKTIALGPDGQPIKSGATLEPKPLNEVLIEIIKPYIAKRKGGTGEEDYTPGQDQEGSYEAFVKEMEKAGHKPGSEKFQLEMKKRVANNTLSL